MMWKFWCSFSFVLSLLIIVTEAKANFPSLIIENIISKKINPDVLRIDIKQADGTVLHQVEFKKTKGILANSRTPVIKYFDNIENKEMLMKFYPDYEVMQEIGNFSFYHDVDNKASAVLFSDSDGYYLDGIIGDAFRLNRFPVNYLNNILKTPERHIKESSLNVESLKENTWSKLNNTVQNVDAFYPELLIVLDYNLIANVPKIQAIKTQLVYWNAVDMLFASMKSPEIYLNIAAFILPSSKHAFQFLENDPGTSFVDFYDAIEGVETLFYKYRDQISVDYDIIVAMTGAKLCVRPTRASPIMNCINGFSEGKPDISNKFDDEREAVDPSAILHFDNQVSSYTNAAQKIGYMFTGEFTQKKEKKKCPGIMEEYYRRGKFSLSWSTCTQRKVVDYLQSPKAKGLKNFPTYLLEAKKSQPLPIESPKPSEGWLSNLGNWLFKKNKNKNDEISDVIITTQPSVHEATQLTITTEASLSEIPKKVLEINEPNVDLQQEFITSETSLTKLTDLITATEPFLPEVIEKIPEITEQVPEINESNADLEHESTESEVFLDNFSTTPSSNVYSTIVPSPQNYVKNDISIISTNPSVYFSTEPPSASFFDEDKKNESPNFESRIGEEKINALEPVNNYSELRIEDLPSTTTKLLSEKGLKIQDDYVFIDVTVSSKESDASAVDDHTDISENNLEESTVSLKLNQQNLSDVSVVEPVIEEQIDRQKRQNPLGFKIRIDPDDELLTHERKREKASDEEILAHEQEKEKVSDEDLLAHERGGEQVSDEDLIAHEREGEKVSDEDLIAHEKNDQKILPNEQEGAEASDKFPPTLKPDKTLTDLSTLARENKLEFYGRNKRFRSLPVKRESSFSNFNDTETIIEEATEQYSNQNDSILNINTSNNYETITEPISEQYSNQNDSLLDLDTSNNNETATELIIEQYSNQNELVLSLNTSTTSAPLMVSLLSRTSEVNSSSTELVQDDSTTATVALISATESTSPTESSVSSTESTSSPTQPSCKRENMKLDVTLQLNINTNDKNIKTLKKSFHDGSLNQENDNATDTFDNNKVIKNIIDYLLKNSNR